VSRSILSSSCIKFCSYYWYFLAIVFVGCAGGENPKASIDTTEISTNDSSETWIPLFDEQTLAGWHSYGKTEAGSAWQADSGTIHLLPGARNGYQTAQGGDLVTDSMYTDFILRLEWKVSRSANSGILLYVQEDTAKYKETWNTGWELEVCDHEYNGDAHVHKRDGGEIYDLIAATSREANGYGEWNKVEIRTNKGKVDVWLNGTKNLDFRIWDDNWNKLIAGSKFKTMPGFGTFTKGHIALQDHGQEVWYRNIYVKKL